MIVEHDLLSDVITLQMGLDDYSNIIVALEVRRDRHKDNDDPHAQLIVERMDAMLKALQNMRRK